MQVVPRLGGASREESTCGGVRRIRLETHKTFNRLLV